MQTRDQLKAMIFNRFAPDLQAFRDTCGVLAGRHELPNLLPPGGELLKRMISSGNRVRNEIPAPMLDNPNAKGFPSRGEERPSRGPTGCVVTVAMRKNTKTANGEIVGFKR